MNNHPTHHLWKFILLISIISLVACSDLDSSSNILPSENNLGETGLVTNVIDGDTIDVIINGQEIRIRYVGVNTPERDEACYSEAREANRALVSGQTVRLVRDVSDTDRYGRLLRYIYVGNTFVNEQLVALGFAEAVLYDPDDRFHEDFLRFERNAARLSLGCHPTGIFDDGSTTR